MKLNNWKKELHFENKMENIFMNSENSTLSETYRLLINL